MHTVARLHGALLSIDLRLHAIVACFRSENSKAWTMCTISQRNVDGIVDRQVSDDPILFVLSLGTVDNV